jgi:hypothetical protein
MLVILLLPVDLLMVVKSPDKSTVINQLANVLLLAPPMPCVLVHKVSTACLMDSASPAEMTLIVPPEMLGMEMVVKPLHKLSVIPLLDFVLLLSVVEQIVTVPIQQMDKLDRIVKLTELA